MPDQISFVWQTPGNVNQLLSSNLNHNHVVFELPCCAVNLHLETCTTSIHKYSIGDFVNSIDAFIERYN